MNNLLSLLGITPADMRDLLLAAQTAYAILTVGLVISWYKSRHPGVLLSAGLFGSGAYFSYFSFSDNPWLPLGAAFVTSAVLKSMGFQMGYH